MPRHVAIIAALLALVLAAGCPQPERRDASTAPAQAVVSPGGPPQAPGANAAARQPPCLVTPLLERATVTFVPEQASESRVAVEVARTDGQRQKGLMCRIEMADGDGMLFLFDDEDVQSFWMQNTYLPLDMIFVKHDLTVAGVVHDTEPQTQTPRYVDDVSQYVVEVNAGWARRHGIVRGTRVQFDGLRGFQGP